MSEDTPQSSSRYEVITTLGQGGMARVLLTMSRGPAGVTKLLVVKELKDELKAEPEFVTMFLDEARIAARLNHPNVIQTYEVSQDGAHPVIVMEYLEGQPLNLLLARVGRANMPLDLHAYILSQAAAGLHYAHELKSFDGSELGLVHRDVSPQNVFVTYDGRVLIVDFGIAKAAGSAILTKAGVFKGKVGYAAPEQIAATGAIDRRADVFSLGVMLWEALARKRMAQGDNELAVMNRRLHGIDPKIGDVAPDAPEELRRACDEAMAPRPEDRHATAATLRAAIDEYLGTTRRVGPEEVGALVRAAFAADREKVRALVEAQIKLIQSPTRPGATPAPISLPAVPDVTPTRREASEPGDSTVKVSSNTAPSAVAAKPGGSVLPRIALAVVALAAVVSFVAQRKAGPALSGEGTAASVSRAAEAGPTATVEVTLEVEPRDARITLDGAVIDQNPFRGAMPRSGLARTLRVAAPGFVSDERMVTFDRDLHLTLALQAEAAALESASASATPVVGGQAAVGPTKGGPAASPASAAAASKGPGPTPGDALSGPQQKKPRSIDDTF